MNVTSSAFKEGERIPKEYTGEGKDQSPPLAWSGVPTGVKSFALVCEDPDAPRGIWVHWVMFNLSPNVQELPAAVPTTSAVLDGASQGTNDFDKVGYGGPMPPRGQTHRYYFIVYALDTKLDMKAGSTRRQDLLDAMKGHVLAQGQLMGTFGR